MFILDLLQRHVCRACWRTCRLTAAAGRLPAAAAAAWAGRRAPAAWASPRRSLLRQQTATAQSEQQGSRACQGARSWKWRAIGGSASTRGRSDRRCGAFSVHQETSLFLYSLLCGTARGRIPSSLVVDSQTYQTPLQWDLNQGVILDHTMLILTLTVTLPTAACMGTKITVSHGKDGTPQCVRSLSRPSADYLLSGHAGTVRASGLRRPHVPGAGLSGRPRRPGSAGRHRRLPRGAHGLVSLPGVVRSHRERHLKARSWHEKLSEGAC